MLWQCACCGKKIDDQEDNYEAMEVRNERGAVWYYFHVNCLDDLRATEQKRKSLGKATKSVLSQNVVAIKGSWTRQAVL